MRQHRLHYMEFERRFWKTYLETDLAHLCQRVDSSEIQLSRGICCVEIRANLFSHDLDLSANGVTFEIAAVAPKVAHITNSGLVDWHFFKQHPLLWQFEPKGEIFCNTAIDDTTWINLLAATSRKLSGAGLSGPIPPFQGPVVNPSPKSWPREGSFFLGKFPKSVFDAVNTTLNEHGIPHTSRQPSNAKSIPMLLTLNATDYIIADDFSVDAPAILFYPPNREAVKGTKRPL